MDLNTIWTLVTVICIPVIGYLYNDLKKKVEGNSEEIMKQKLYTAENYVSKTELAKAVEGLSKTIDEVKAATLRIESYIFAGAADRRNNR